MTTGSGNTLLKNLLEEWKSSGKCRILELRNKDMLPVAAVYLDKLDFSELALAETGTSERYYLYSGGIGVFFTYYSKMG